MNLMGKMFNAHVFSSRSHAKFVYVCENIKFSSDGGIDTFPNQLSSIHNDITTAKKLFVPFFFAAVLSFSLLWPKKGDIVKMLYSVYASIYLLCLD